MDPVRVHFWINSARCYWLLPAHCNSELAYSWSRLDPVTGAFVLLIFEFGWVGRTKAPGRLNRKLIMITKNVQSWQNSSQNTFNIAYWLPYLSKMNFRGFRAIPGCKSVKIWPFLDSAHFNTLAQKPSSIQIHSHAVTLWTSMVLHGHTHEQTYSTYQDTRRCVPTWPFERVILKCVNKRQQVPIVFNPASTNFPGGYAPQKLHHVVEKVK